MGGGACAVFSHVCKFSDLGKMVQYGVGKGGGDLHIGVWGLFLPIVGLREIRTHPSYHSHDRYTS